MATRRPAPSSPCSTDRLAEIDAAIMQLHERLAAQPKGEAGFARRARLALLIGAFERRRDLVAAAQHGRDLAALRGEPEPEPEPEPPPKRRFGK